MEYIPVVRVLWYNDKCMDRIVPKKKSKLTAVPYTLRARSWFSKETTIANKKGGRGVGGGGERVGKVQKEQKSAFQPEKRAARQSARALEFFSIRESRRGLYFFVSRCRKGRAIKYGRYRAGEKTCAGHTGNRARSKAHA